jgi:hypothetical protein
MDDLRPRTIYASSRYELSRTRSLRLNLSVLGEITYVWRSSSGTLTDLFVQLQKASSSALLKTRNNNSPPLISQQPVPKPPTHHHNMHLLSFTLPPLVLFALTASAGEAAISNYELGTCQNFWFTTELSAAAHTSSYYDTPGGV